MLDSIDADLYNNLQPITHRKALEEIYQIHHWHPFCTAPNVIHLCFPVLSDLEVVANVLLPGEVVDVQVGLAEKQVLGDVLEARGESHGAGQLPRLKNIHFTRGGKRVLLIFPENENAYLPARAENH